MNQSKLFGRRVRAIRKASGITQEEAAEAAHLNSKYLGEIERGEKHPSFEVILTLASARDVSAASFFQFEHGDGDEKAIRRRIEALLQRCSPQQIGVTYRILKGLLEP